MSDKPHDIKVSGCDGCPFFHENFDPECTHPFQHYDGGRVNQFIEHCPLKGKDTVIKFERPKSKIVQKLIETSKPSDFAERVIKDNDRRSHAISFANFLELHPNYNQSAATREFGYEIFTGHILKEK